MWKRAVAWFSSDRCHLGTFSTKIVFVKLMTLQTILSDLSNRYALHLIERLETAPCCCLRCKRLFHIPVEGSHLENFGSSAACLRTYINLVPKKWTRPGFPRISWEVPPDFFDVLPDYSYISMQWSVGTLLSLEWNSLVWNETHEWNSLLGLIQL
jgi:hypothetical protein